MQLWAKSHGIPLVCSYHTQFSSYVQYYFSRPLSTIAEAVVSWIIYMFYRPCRQVYVPTSYVADALSVRAFARMLPKRCACKAPDLSHRVILGRAKGSIMTL